MTTMPTVNPFTDLSLSGQQDTIGKDELTYKVSIVISLKIPTVAANIVTDISGGATWQCSGSDG